MKKDFFGDIFFLLEVIPNKNRNQQRHPPKSWLNYAGAWVGGELGGSKWPPKIWR